MSKKLKKIPSFKSEDEERKFWSTHDSTEYIDVAKLQQVHFPNLKRTNAISLRLPHALFSKIEKEAHKEKVSTEQLVKEILAMNFKSNAENRGLTAGAK